MGGRTERAESGVTPGTARADVYSNVSTEDLMRVLQQRGVVLTPQSASSTPHAEHAAGPAMVNRSGEGGPAGPRSVQPLATTTPGTMRAGTVLPARTPDGFLPTAMVAGSMIGPPMTGHHRPRSAAQQLPTRTPGAGQKRGAAAADADITPILQHKARSYGERLQQQGRG